MNKEIYNDIATCNMLDAIDCAAADVKSSILDTQDFESALIVVDYGVMTGGDASNYVTAVLQESDTTVDGDFTTVGSTDKIGSFVAITAALANYSDEQKVAYIGTKRYVRVLLDYTISGGGAPVTALLASVLGLMSNARIGPPSEVAPTAAT